MGTQVLRRAAWSFAVLGVAVAAVLGWPRAGLSQATSPDHTKHAQHVAAEKAISGDEALAAQLRQLKDKVAKLEAALSQSHGVNSPAPMGQGQATGVGNMTMDAGRGMAQSTRVAAQFQDCLRCHQSRPSGALPQSHLEKPAPMGMGMMSGMGMGEMGMMAQGGMGEMGMMAQGGMGDRQPMGMMDDDGMMMGMEAMGKAKRMGMGSMSMKTSLPGFPGASHLYHIGAEGFFLNHDEHITLSADQKKKLNRIKEKAGLSGSSCGRKVEEAEQELWELTASDSPDASAIEAKIREIEKLRGDQRLSFVRAVGEAAKVLTDDQRMTLVGAAATTHANPPGTGGK